MLLSSDTDEPLLSFEADLSTQSRMIGGCVGAGGGGGASFGGGGEDSVEFGPEEEDEEVDEDDLSSHDVLAFENIAFLDDFARSPYNRLYSRSTADVLD